MQAAVISGQQGLEAYNVGEGETILGSCKKPSSSPCGPADEGRLWVLKLPSVSGAGLGRCLSRETYRRWGGAFFSGDQQEAPFQDYRTRFFPNGVMGWLGFWTSRGTFEGGSKHPWKIPQCDIPFPPFRLEEGLFYSPLFSSTGTDFMAVIFGRQKQKPPSELCVKTWAATRRLPQAPTVGPPPLKCWHSRR